MAERRMIHKKISFSESVDGLSKEAQLFFTWSIPHADDLGFLPRSPRKLKGMVFPLKDLTSEHVEKIVQEIIKSGMYTPCSHGVDELLLIKGFDRHQTLRKDQQPFTYLDIELGKSKRDNWDKVSKIKDELLNGKNTETSRKREGNDTVSEEKGREGKRREGKGKELSAGKPADEPEIINQEDKDVNDLIFSFRSVNPNYEILFKRKPQCEAMKRMLKKFSFEKMKGLIDQIIPIINDDKYFGTPITTPIQLENDLAKVVTWLKRQEKDQKSKVKDIKGLNKFLNNEK